MENEEIVGAETLLYDENTGLDEYMETLDDHPNWDRRLLFVKYADTCCAFRPVNMSYEEAEAHIDDIELAWDVVMSALNEHSDNGGEDVGLTDFFSMIVQVLADNLTTELGAPFLLEPIGWGTCAMDYIVEDTEDEDEE